VFGEFDFGCSDFGRDVLAAVFILVRVSGFSTLLSGIRSCSFSFARVGSISRFYHFIRFSSFVLLDPENPPRGSRGITRIRGYRVHHLARVESHIRELFEEMLLGRAGEQLWPLLPQLREIVLGGIGLPLTGCALMRPSPFER
jgi:hypothetical protein